MKANCYKAQSSRTLKYLYLSNSNLEGVSRQLELPFKIQAHISSC